KKNPRTASQRRGASSTLFANVSRLPRKPPKLKASKIDDIQVVEGSGNVWYDTGYPDYEERGAKTELGVAIRHRIEVLGITQTEAAKRLGIPKTRVSEIFNLHVQGYSIERLSALLVKLGAHVQLTVAYDRTPGFQVQML